MQRNTRAFTAALGALLLVGSCVGGESPVSPDDLVTMVPLPLQAVIEASVVTAAAQPINRIRASAERVPDRKVMGSTTLDVSPTAPDWEVALEIPVLAPIQVVVYLQLIHVDGLGNETVEFSGRTNPIQLSAGVDMSAADVPMVRGPLDNLAVTGVEISQAPSSLLEGASGALAAELTTSTDANPVVFWAVLDSAVLQIDGTTVMGLAPGTGRVVASAGAHADTASIPVLARPTAVVIAQDTLQALGVGAEVTFTGIATDIRGDTIDGAALLWRSLDATVAESLGDGVFRSLALGFGTVEARAAADTTVKATAVMSVGTISIDLAVEKAASAASAFEGDTVGFTISLANLGVEPVSSASVVDSLPTGLSLVGVTASQGSYDVPTSTWSIDTPLEPGATATLAVTTTVDVGTVGQTLVNTARAVPARGNVDVDAANDQASATVSVGTEASDIAVTKTVDKAAPRQGDVVGFTVTVTNNGPLDATGIVVSDSLPAGLTWDSEVLSAGVTSLGEGLYGMSSLPAGASDTLFIAAVVDSGTVGETITNVARLQSLEQVDTVPANDEASAAVTVEAAQIDVELMVAIDAPAPLEDSLVVLVVTVVNHGPTLATGLSGTGDWDSWTIDMVDDSAVATHGQLVDSLWTVGSLPAGDTATLRVFNTLLAGAAGDTLIFWAEILTLDQVDTVPANDSSVVVTTLVGSGLDIAITTSSSAASITEGDSLTYTVTAFNAGPGDATGLTIRDSIPEPLVFASATATAGSYDPGTHTWTIGTLLEGATDSLTLVARAPDGTGGRTGENWAAVASLDQPDVNPANDLASVFTGVNQRRLDVELLTEVDNPVPLEESPVTFLVKAVNHGPGLATGIEGVGSFSSTGPAVLLDSVAMSQGTLVDSLWTVGTLAQGDTATLWLYHTVPLGAGGDTITMTNRITSVAQFDTLSANDVSAASIIIPLDNPPTLTLTSPLDGSVYDPGDTISFAATATDPEDGDLTGTIQWTSSIDGLIGTGGAFSSATLSPGTHLVTARVVDSALTPVTASVRFVIAIVTAPVSLNVPYGGTASLPITLSAPAPVGDLTVSVTSSDPTIANPVSTVLTIPEGSTSANAVMQGLLPGSADVTVSSAGYGSATTVVSVTARFNITASTLAFPEPFPQDFTVRLESGGSPIAAAAGGVEVTLTSRAPECVAVPGSIAIPEGLVSRNATASYGGVATTSCTTWVVASNPTIDADSVRVTVQPQPTIQQYTNITVGSGLMYGSLNASLGTTMHGGTTVRIESTDSTKLLISPNATTPGTPFIDVDVAAGSQWAYYFIHGLEGITADTVPVTASAPLFLPSSQPMAIAQPGLDIVGLPTSTTSFSADDPFQVRIGIPNATATVLASNQRIRPGGVAVEATVTASDPSVGELITTTDSVSPVTVRILPGQDRSPNTVAAGGVAFNPISGGVDSVSATIPGFVATGNATASVTVEAPLIYVSDYTVGSGLQAGAFYATLQSGSHGGVTLRLESSDSTVMLVSPDLVTPGSPFIDIEVPDGTTRLLYYVQGVEGQDSVTASLVASAAGFVTDSATIEVIQASYEVIGVNTSTTSLSPDDPFYVRVGVAYAGQSRLRLFQPVRAGGDTLTATLTSSDPAVGELITLPDSTSPVTVRIAPGQHQSPTSVGAGGVALDPVGGGTTEVSGSIPGLLPTDYATWSVTVSQPVISIGSTTVGSSLHVGYLSANLQASAHGGVTVRIESSNPSVLLVAPDPSTAGTAFIDVPLADGVSRANYYLQGVADIIADSAVVTASASGFLQDTATVRVRQPGIQLSGLSYTSVTTFSPDDPFVIQTGVPSETGTSLQYYQFLAPTADTLTVTVTSSQTGVGVVKNSVASGGSVTTVVRPGERSSPSTVVLGGVAFDPLGTGTTTVAASAPGFVTTTAASRDVPVSSPSINIGNATVGAGLQYARLGSLQASQHGGVTVRLTSSNPSVFLIAPNATSAGAAFIDVVVPNGTTRIDYVLHGVEGAEGTATLTASAPGFTDGSATVTVVASAVEVYGLVTTTTAAGASDVFQARIGVPYSGLSQIQLEQAVRVGGSGVTATMTSSDAALAQLVTQGTVGGTVTVQIEPGQSRSATTVSGGGVEFDPLAAGSVQVNVSIPGFLQVTSSTRTVTINP